MTLKRTPAAYWAFTALFALQMGFTAYAQLRLPQVAQVFAHLAVGDGFSPWTWSVVTAVLGGLSYHFHTRREAPRAGAHA
jgi:hypothetical protein